jgi:hypothetical protein
MPSWVGAPSPLELAEDSITIVATEAMAATDLGGACKTPGR